MNETLNEKLIDKFVPKEWQTPTMLLIFINIIFYIMTSIIGGHFIITGPKAIILFGISLFSLEHGMFWTLFTSIFTHASIAHIGFNMIYLAVFGSKLEDRNYSGKGIIFAYVVTGVLAGVLSLFFFFSPTSLSVGASGSVFGLLGLNAGIEYKENNPNYKRVVFLSIILFIFSTSPNTNVFAHLLGLIFGFMLGDSDYFEQFNLNYQQYK